MLIKSFTEAVKQVTDLQIQTSVHRIGIRAEVGSKMQDDDGTPIYIELRHVSNRTGTTYIVPKMPLHSVLEIDSFGQGEGFFELSTRPGGGFGIHGSFVVGVGGSLDMSEGYLSLDIVSAQDISDLRVETIDHPVQVSTYRAINPFIVNGVTREIDLKGVHGLVLAPGKLDNVQIQIGQRNLQYTGSELDQLAKSINDIVLYDHGTRGLVAGLWLQAVLGVQSSQSARITPRNGEQYTQYLLEDKTLGE